MKCRWLLMVLFVLSFGLGSEQASATLLFSGGEDIDFICVSGTCSVNTGGPTYRSAWARESVDVAGTTVDPPTNRLGTPAFAGNSTLWIHAQYCTVGGGNCYTNGTDSGAQMLRIMDSSGNPTIIVRGTGTSGAVKISSRTAAGVFTDLVTCPSTLNYLVQLDLYVNYGSSGEVALYSNSVKVCDYTGDVTNGDGATTLNQVEFGSPQSYSGGWSEVIVATTDTRAMSRYTAYTVANGNTADFLGTNVCSSIWAAKTVNDANYGYSGSTNAIQECTISSSIPAGSYNVLGLVMSARALVGSSGPLHFSFVTRTNATDYFSSDYAPTTSFNNFTNYIQTVNPATSNPWAVSDFQATGFNVGEETKP